MPRPRALFEVICARFSAEGLHGRLELVSALPESAVGAAWEGFRPAIVCRLFARGDRRLVRSESEVQIALRTRRELPRARLDWVTDQQAALTAVDAAIRWVSEAPAGTLLRSGPQEALALDRSADVARTFVAEGLTTSAGVAAWWESEETLQLIECRAGVISLVVGGAQLERGDWRSAHNTLLVSLYDAGDWASYGFVTRGAARWAEGRIQLEVPGDSGRSFRTARAAPWRDVFLPDIYGAQLLGGGYRGRVPAVADWEHIELSNGASLLLHREPSTWFATDPGWSDEYLDVATDPGMPESLLRRLLQNENLPPAVKAHLDRYEEPDDPSEVRVRAQREFAAILHNPDVPIGGDLDPLATLESVRG
jgi:hypothetical protein